MAYFLSIFLAMVVVFAKKSEAIGGIQERLQRLPARQELTNEELNPSNDEDIDKLAALLKKDTLTVLCESGKVNPAWCRYEQLLARNGQEREQEQKTIKKKRAAKCWPGLPLSCKGLAPARLTRAADIEIKKKRAAGLCWPGLPQNCKGLVPARLSRAVDNKNYIVEGVNSINNNNDDDDEEVNNYSTKQEVQRANNNIDEEVNNIFNSNDDYDDEEMNNTINDDIDEELNNYNAEEDEKRALKCRPGMANCRRKKKGKRGKRTMLPSKATQHCPQGWMYCDKK